MNRDLSKGSVVKSMLLFAIPMILGDLLQQCYNIADTLIVGQFLGEKALAAVGSSFTLMTFITSIILGLCMGSGALFSIRFGQRDENGLKEDICASFFFITAVTILLNIIAYISLSGLRNFLRVPDEVWGDMKEYLFVIFMGIPAVFLSVLFSEEYGRGFSSIQSLGRRKIMKSTNKILMAILIINTAFVTIKLCIRICNKIAIDIPIPVDRPIYGFPKKVIA